MFSQPGLRYSQAESLIKSLMMDETFKNIDAQERKRITERILDAIKGRMLEEIVQLETKKANPKFEVFKFPCLSPIVPFAILLFFWYAIFWYIIVF